MSDLVDVHAHFNHPAYFQALQEAGGFEELSIFKILGHLWRDQSTRAQAVIMGTDEALAARVAEMDATGIAQQVLSIGAPQPYLSDPAAAAHVAALANDLYAEAIAAAPGRLYAFATLPLPHVEEALAEVRRTLEIPGFVGVSVGCSAGGVPLDDERFEPLWAELDRRGAAVYMHPGVAIDRMVGALDYHLAPDFVSPAEVALAVSRLIVREVIQRHPRIVFVIATLGGSLPFLARRFDRGLLQDNPDDHERLGGVLHHFRSPNLLYDTSVIEEPLALLAAKQVFGADRIVLGTDFSRPSVRLQPAIDYVRDSEYLTADEKDAILRRNGIAALSAA